MKKALRTGLVILTATLAATLYSPQTAQAKGNYLPLPQETQIQLEELENVLENQDMSADEICGKCSVTFDQTEKGIANLSDTNSFLRGRYLTIEECNKLYQGYAEKGSLVPRTVHLTDTNKYNSPFTKLNFNNYNKEAVISFNGVCSGKLDYDYFDFESGQTISYDLALPEIVNCSMNLTVIDKRKPKNKQ